MVMRRIGGFIGLLATWAIPALRITNIVVSLGGIPGDLDGWSALLVAVSKRLTVPDLALLVVGLLCLWFAAGGKMPKLPHWHKQRGIALEAAQRAIAEAETALNEYGAVRNGNEALRVLPFLRAAVLGIKRDYGLAAPPERDDYGNTFYDWLEYLRETVPLLSGGHFPEAKTKASELANKRVPEIEPVPAKPALTDVEREKIAATITEVVDFVGTGLMPFYNKLHITDSEGPQALIEAANEFEDARAMLCEVANKLWHKRRYYLDQISFDITPMLHALDRLQLPLLEAAKARDWPEDAKADRAKQVYQPMIDVGQACGNMNRIADEKRQEYLG